MRGRVAHGEWCERRPAPDGLRVAPYLPTAEDQEAMDAARQYRNEKESEKQELEANDDDASEDDDGDAKENDSDESDEPGDRKESSDATEESSDATEESSDATEESSDAAESTSAADASEIKEVANKAAKSSEDVDAEDDLDSQIAKLTAQLKDLKLRKVKKLKRAINRLSSKVSAAQQEEEEQNKDTLEDATRYLMEGPAFMPFVTEHENCSKREDEWAERCQIRTAEMVVIAEAINALADNDILDDLLKQSWPKPWQEAEHHAIAAAKKVRHNWAAQFDLMSLAMKGRNASVAKIFEVIDGMVSMLGQESPTIPQETFCGQSINQTEDKLKRLDLTVSELGIVIRHHEKSIETLKREIEDVKAGITTLDKSIVDRAVIRKQEYEEYAGNMTYDNVTYRVLRAARDRVREYYTEGFPADNDTKSLSAIIGPYQKKMDDANNVLAMLNKQVSELGVRVSQLESKEVKDQDEWERVIKESLEKHARDMKAITDKQKEKADIEARARVKKVEKVEKMQEVKAATKYLSQLKGNNTGFLRPAVCAMKPSSPKKAAQPLLQDSPSLGVKNFVIW